MTPEPLTWDRKVFSKERKRERSPEFKGSPSRWRETPHPGSPFRSRPLGHGKQGGWPIYSEESGRGFRPSQSNNGSISPSGYNADGRCGRNSREDRRTFGQKDWEQRHSWEYGNGSSPYGLGRPLALIDQRSVDDMRPYNSHTHSNFANNWDQLHLKGRHNETNDVNGLGTGGTFERGNSLCSTDWKTLKWGRSGRTDSVNGLGTGGRFERGNSPCSTDWKTLKWGRSGRFSSSRGSGFGHSSSSKSMGVNSGNSVPVLQCPSGDAVAAPSAAKKPRLGWGEGLAKYEKKTVGGFSDCASPATPFSVPCSSSPGVEDKLLVREANIDSVTGKLCGSPSQLSQNLGEGIAFKLENLELRLGELLQSEDPGRMDSFYESSTAMEKLLVWKGEISKALEMTETEIDLCENELKLLTSESRNSWPCLAGSSSLEGKCQSKPCKDLVVNSNLILQPASLQLVSSRDMIAEEASGGLEEEHGPVKGGTATSEFVELLSTRKSASFVSLEHGESSGNLDVSKVSHQVVNCSVYGYEDKTEGVSASVSGGQLITSMGSAPPVGAIVLCGSEDVLYNQIIVSNKDSATRASEVFNMLLPSEQQHHNDISRTASVCSWQVDPLIKENFALRRHFSRFKERVLTLKFRVFQHIWKEEVRVLSTRKYRAKSHKGLDQSSRKLHDRYKKHRSSPAGNFSLVPTAEIISFTNKLLSDSQGTRYRNSLKMPALILDEKEKIMTRFISSHGLVEDPCAVEKERVMINPWTTEEKEIFMDKFATCGKDFRKIASFLDHKTTADCIEFYYKNHKSDWFVKIKRKPECAMQGKLCSNNYLVTSGKLWNRERNVASLDMLGVPVAANANDGRKSQRRCKIRFVKGTTTVKKAQDDDGTMERSGSLDIFSNERETAAADVLAGICGSSSSGPEESYKDRKSQKLGSLAKLPLIPEVTCNVDDETCSDESCGEMNPADWTDDEKSIFIQAVSSHGKDFTMISRCLRTRTKDECKVFFSKARNCLGLDMICPGPANEEVPVSDNANTGGGRDNEYASVLDTGSVICSEKLTTVIDKEMMHSDLNNKHCESDPADVQTDLNRSNKKGTGGMKCIDPELESENMVTEDSLADHKLEFHFDCDRKMENGLDSMSVTLQTDKNAVLPPDTEIGLGEAYGGSSFFGESLLAKDTNDHGLSVSGAEGEIISACLELEGQQLASEFNLTDKQEENGSAITGGPSDSNSHDILHTSLVNANSLTKVTPTSQYEKTLNSDTPLTLDLFKMSDKQCPKSANVDDHNLHCSGHALLDRANSCQILGGYPLPVSTKKKMNGKTGSNKLASLQSLSEVDLNFSSAVAKLPFLLSREQKGDERMNYLGFEKPMSYGFWDGKRLHGFWNPHPPLRG